MREVIKLGIVLLVITAVAAAVLGYTNAVTEEPIANQTRKANIAARQSVLPNADEFEQIPQEEFQEIKNVVEVYRGLKNGQTVGYTIKTNPSGYGGPVEVMIGIGMDAVIHGISIGNHAETPGLGAKAEEETFKGQYKGKKAEGMFEVIKAGEPQKNQIQSIAGATITSKAVTDGVNTAVQLFNDKLK